MSPSAIDPQLPPLRPSFDLDGTRTESDRLRAVIEKLRLQPHVEGGYFVETDRDTQKVPNPFWTRGDGGKGSAASAASASAATATAADTRSASTTIHYLLTPQSPLGALHRNKGRTVHTLHRGRGRYVIIHADEVASSPSHPGGYGGEEGDGVDERERWTGKARIETFVVGPDVLKGERLQWIVDGGKYKTSYLLPCDEDDDGAGRGGGASEGLLISETVVPGFEFSDHDFMREERLKALVTEEQAKEMGWMLRKAD